MPIACKGRYCWWGKICCWSGDTRPWAGRQRRWGATGQAGEIYIPLSCWHVLELFAGEDEVLLVRLRDTYPPRAFNVSLGCLLVKMRWCLSRGDETRILKLFASKDEGRKALLVGQRNTHTGADSDVMTTSEGQMSRCHWFYCCGRLSTRHRIALLLHKSNSFFK